MPGADIQNRLACTIYRRSFPKIAEGIVVQRYSYSIALRIWHPSIDPAQITANLGLKPKCTNTAGQPRRTPKGRPLDGTYAESYWSADPFDRGEYSSTDDLAEDALAEVLEVLAPHKVFLLSLRESGARIILQVSSFSGRNYAVELSPALLAQSADLGLSIAHDVYPFAQHW